MTPQARVQAAIEILDLIIVSARDNGPAADAIVAEWTKNHRFAGSKDKRAIREHVYAAIRALGERPVSGRAAMLTLLDGDLSLFDGSSYGPALAHAGEERALASLMPHWLAQLVPVAEHAALLERAPMDLRVNRLKASPDSVIGQFEGAVALPHLQGGIRLAAHLPIEHHPAWAAGEVEVQDAGSQWVVEACAVRPGMTAIDLCAGAGGKTLGLAAAMGGEGQLIAADTNRERLRRLPPRAERAGASNIDIRLLDPGRELESLADLEAAADLVLVDAPCSGSGTWRRNPESRWRLTPDRLAQVVNLQASILKTAAQLVRPGGALVYAVCSLIEAEGRDQVGHFLEARPRWQAEPLNLPVGRPDGGGTRLTPAHDGTDGFFFARLAKPC